MAVKELLVYIDGKFYPKSQAKISVFDHGLLYGDGVFEGIRAYEGLVFKLIKHVERLYRSAKMIMLTIPIEEDKMEQIVLQTLQKNNLRESYIRLIVTRGVGDLGLNPKKCPKPTIICITDTISLMEGREENGITAMISWVRRNPVDATSHEIKSLNYLNSVLAKIEANIAGADEAICLDKSGFVCEGVGENIFIINSDLELVTPPTCTGALEGITAKTVREIAKKLGHEVVVRNITPFELFTAKEIFLTGTAAEIAPVVKINGRLIFGGRPGPVTKDIMEVFKKLVRDWREGTPIYE
jgi:branched-chain amino acid aminotransferase